MKRVLNMLKHEQIYFKLKIKFFRARTNEKQEPYAKKREEKSSRRMMLNGWL